MRLLPLVAAGLSLVGGCARGSEGTWLVRGVARGIAVAPAGDAVAFLVGAAHPDEEGVPDDLVEGDLYLSSAGAPARKIGAGVSSAAGSYAFAPSGSALAFLARFRFRAGEGELWLAPASGEPRLLAAGVSAFAWSPRGRSLAFIARSVLQVVAEEGAPPASFGEARSFAWSPDGVRIAARGPSAAGGRLLLVQPGSGEARQAAAASSDFAFARDGALAILGPVGPKGGDRPLLLLEPGAAKARPMGRATAISFSPQGESLAILSTARAPGEALGDLTLISRRGGEVRTLASRVSEWHWSSTGNLLCLARYDLRSRSGSLLLAPAGGGEPRTIAERVQAFSVQGRWVLYLAQKPSRRDFKIELWSLDLGPPGGMPQRVDEGVYGYELSPDGASLYFRSQCGGLRSCKLFRVPMDGSSAPLQLASAVAGFELSRDGARLLTAQVHPGRASTVDLRILDARGPPPPQPPPFLATEVDGSSRFADATGKTVIVAIAAAGNEGVRRLSVP